MRAATRREGGEVSLLAAILEGTANLSGAACVDSPGLFDARDADEDVAAYRHTAAARICGLCPVIDACRSWADSRADQEHAVTAGRVPRQPGRPRKGGEAA